MSRIKTLIVFAVTTFYFPVVPWCKRLNQFMADSMFSEMPLKQSRLVMVCCKPIREFRSVIRLDTLNGQGKGFYQMIRKLSGGVGIVLFKGLYKAPAGKLINGSILKKMFSNDFTVLEADGRNKFHIDLDPLPGMIHLFIGLWDILWIVGMNRHEALFLEKTVKPRDRTRVAALPKLDPENHQSGIRITSAQIRNELDFGRRMMVGVMVRTLGELTMGRNGTIESAFPAIDILSVGLIFDSNLGNTMFFSIIDKG